MKKIDKMYTRGDVQALESELELVTAQRRCLTVWLRNTTSEYNRYENLFSERSDYIQQKINNLI